MSQSGYFSRLSRHFGKGWNQFWFLKSDPINVSVLRILIGLLALWYQLSFTFDLISWFSSEGILPVKTVYDTIQATGVIRNDWSYLNYFQDPSALWIAHGLGAIVLLLFTLGLYTRATSVLSLIVILSYLHRSPFLVGQMEPILAIALCYLCLAPSGTCLSLDAMRLRRKDKKGAIGPPNAPHSTGATLAIRLLQVHLTALYLFIVASQLAGAGVSEDDMIIRPWWDGSAVWWLMAHSDSRLVDFTFLKSVPYVVFAITHGIILFEIAYAIFIWKAIARPLLIGISCVVWIFLALITGLVGYCALMFVLNIAFISPESLRRGIDRVFPTKHKIALPEKGN